MPVVCCYGHPFLLWDKSYQIFIANFFKNNTCFLTFTKLRQLHRHFGYLSTGNLHKVLECTRYETEK